MNDLYVVKKSKEIDSQMRSNIMQENSIKQDPQQFEYGEYYDTGKIAYDLKMAETFNQQHDFNENMKFQDREEVEYPEEYMVSINHDEKARSMQHTRQEEFNDEEAEAEAEAQG